MMNFQIQRWLRILAGMLLLFASSSIAYAQGSPVDFRGTWNTVTSKGKKIVITFETVRRTNVTGTYARNGLTASYIPIEDTDVAFVKVSAKSGRGTLQSISSITGTVTGNVLRFKWLEDGGRGAGRFTMSADFQSFQGTFSRTDNPDDTSGGTWNGTRAPNFHGVWKTTPFPQVLFQQTGLSVSGNLFAGNPDMGVFKEGVLDGNTLRFTVYRPDPRKPIMPYLPDIPVGVGELTMSADGKSFAGKILGTAVSGSLIAGPGRR